MSEIFKNVIFMSIVGNVLTIFLMCLKPLTQKYFGPRWQYYIWLTVLTVMIIPVKIKLPDIIQKTIINSFEQTEINSETLINTETDKAPSLSRMMRIPIFKKKCTVC